jgi:putative ABC transport system permease protein
VLKLACRNLFYDKVRLLVTAVGIVFALVLVLVQGGLFLSFFEMSANVVERSNAGLWITSPHMPYVNGGAALPESLRWRALPVPGVETVELYALYFLNWKLPSGAQEGIQIVGYAPPHGMGGPWNVTAGNVEDLRLDDTVMVDELYAAKLGVGRLGQIVEISDRRARVVGFTRGIRSFTTQPYVFCSFKNAQRYIGVSTGQTIFLLVKLAPGADPAAIKSLLEPRMNGFQVYTNDEMLRLTRRYWMLETGAGLTTVMGAVLGLIVGIAVVAQTIYAATIDHLREFGTLKAMGASNGRIYQVILIQATMSAFIGYAFAIAVAWGVSRLSESSQVPVLLPPELAAGTLALAVLMCMTASVVSIRKATRIDPAMVFRV